MHGETLDRDALIRAFPVQSFLLIRGAGMPVAVHRSYRIPSTTVPYSRRFRNVTEYLIPSTPGMLCSHSSLAGPLSRYAERGSAVSETRSQPVSVARRRRKVQGESSEIPTT